MGTAWSLVFGRGRTAVGVSQQIIDAIAVEFSDLGDVSTVTTVGFRLILALVLGGCLGYERESKGKAAGSRTHMLVALGAALFILGPWLGEFSDNEMSRVIQGLIAGIGFLGAGAIVKGKPGEEIEGLTTAASIWMAAAIGVTAGLGRASTAIFSTALSLLVLSVLWNGRTPPSKNHGMPPNGDKAETT
jgi:putative Mg2+ transporter-C (MgtC) family protein